jgi:pimeloyl-ACP methyl ester carboxylesterase
MLAGDPPVKNRQVGIRRHLEPHLVNKARTSVRRWILRVTVGLVVLLALTVGIMFVVFSSWKSGHVRELERGSRIMTTALGDVEYAVVGTGLPYLSIHGTPGDYDTALTGRRAAPERYDDQMTITLSRPGYLRTPLSSGQTFEQQADLFAALLDKLAIDRAVIVASSGGGYDGLQFALRHPNRCIALVMLSTSVNYEDGPPDRTRNAFLRGIQDFGLWSMTLSDVLPGLMVKDWNRNDPEQVAFFNGVLRGMIPIASHLDGARNDEAQRVDPNIDHWPLERITVPTLLIHGNADENSAYRGSVAVASKIPHAELVTFAGGDHFIPVTHAREIREHIRRFVQMHMVQRGTVQ